MLNTIPENKKYLISISIFLFFILIIPLSLLLSTPPPHKQAKKDIISPDGIKNISIISTSPHNKQQNVDPLSEISVRFNRPVAKKDLFYISLSPDTAGEQTWSPDGRVLWFTPSTSLRPEKKYNVTLFLNDVSRTWTFRTMSEDSINQPDQIKEK